MKKYSFISSGLTAGYFLLTSVAFYILAQFYPSKIGDLFVAFFGASLGGFLGIGAALHIYQKQANDARISELNSIQQTKLAEQHNLQQRRIDHMKWLNGILRQVITYANGQGEEMKAFVEKIKTEPSEVHQLRVIANSSIERLTRADNEATFHAYNTIFAEDPEKDKHYGELLGITDFLAAQVSQVLKSFDGYLKNLYERQLRIKSMLEQSANSLSTIKLSMDFGGKYANLNGSAFHIETNSALLSYNSLIVKARPMKELVSNFVNPLIQTLLGNPHFPGSNELIIKLKDINVAFTDLKHESEHFQQAFNENKLKEPASRLEIVRGRLENGIRSAEAILIK